MHSIPIRFEIKDNIAHCILSNPPKNEMNGEFFRELSRLCHEVFPTLQVSGMLVYGKGNHFSSGANLEELRTLYHSSSPSLTASFFYGNHESFQMIAQLSFPVVAVINGCCLGAGLELALACSHRIASNRAVFALPEATFNLIPGCGGTIRLPKLLSKDKAIELILSGRIVSAEEAILIGLIDACTGKKSLMDKAMSFIHLKDNGSSTPFEGGNRA